jgi:hypothetical protein
VFFDCGFLSRQFEIVRYFHDAFRRNVLQIDDAVFKIAPRWKRFDCYLGSFACHRGRLWIIMRRRGAGFFPLLNFEDQLVITSGWMTLIPPTVFANVKPVIKQNTT